MNTHSAVTSQARDKASHPVVSAPFWEALRTNYWFVPLLCVGLSITAALGLTSFDRWYESAFDDSFAGIDLGQPESVRTVLATIASAMISIATLTFSVTIVALTLATSQFGPRLLYNFMRDRGNQIVLGTFVGIFTFCILVLQSIRSAEGAVFVPHTAVLLSILLSIVGVGVLIYFVHHIAQSIQAGTVISTASGELQNTIARLFPDRRDGTAAEPTLADFPREWNWRISSQEGGILQGVRVADLVTIATEHDVCFKMLHRPGDHVIEGVPLVAHDGSAVLPEAVHDRVRSLFDFGVRRTLVQDLEFAMHQLVEIAVRALSPGINDPFTAIRCVNELATGLAQLLVRADLPTTLCDDHGKPRVDLDQTDFAGLADSALTQIRQHAQRDLAVSIRMLDVLAELAVFVNTRERAAVLISQADRVHATAIRSELIEADRSELDLRHERAKIALRGAVG